MLTTMFTVLSVAFKAFVALSAVGGVTVAFEVVALAVGAGQGDALNDGHESILTKPTTRESQPKHKLQPPRQPPQLRKLPQPQ